MSQIHEGLENKAFNRPSDIVTATVCSKSGKLPTALCGEYLKTEYFTPDTVPTESCDVHFQGQICAYSNLPASEQCPFKVDGVLEMQPENERLLTGQTNADGTIQDTCQHNAEFFLDPNAEAIIEQQRLELQLRQDQNQYAQLLTALQQQLQAATAAKADADTRLAAAADEAAKAQAQNDANQAQSEIDSINAQIAQLQAAQNAAVAAQAAEGTGAQEAAPADDSNGG